MISFSVLDPSPITEGGTAAQSFRNMLDLAQHAERWGYEIAAQVRDKLAPRT
jgi:hypothetical protein